DRIDEGDGGYRVVDYKTGTLPKANDLKQGISLQLVAYALALEQVIAPDAKCVEGVLLQVGTKDTRRVREKGQTNWDNTKEGFSKGLTAALEGIRSAWFPPTPQPDVCAYCDARRMCRIDLSRVERKQEKAE
ncbi:MAG: PD-(D/E)XK nuclease family protein, partial [Candidatus Hydrogenedentes bacterium]|nr:PD-(D/E)XK nuclease family protein [Candidatus Hydrogenedentota bacterium]